jgi:protein-disulfide isomerase
MKRYLGIAMVLFCGLPLAAQTTVGNKMGATEFRDTSALKPPPGAKIAIVEFEDLECPYCAMAAPQVRGTAKQYGIPVVHHDFLISYHHWSRAAAIYARYLEDNVSSKTAEDFRLDVFKRQNMIASREDLQRFANQWFQTHGYAMPFVLDPAGKCAAQVQADCDLSARMGLGHTPTIVVVTAKKWIEVRDVDKLQDAIYAAELDAHLTLPPKPATGRK